MTLWVQVVAFMAARGNSPKPPSKAFAFIRGWDKCVWKGRLDEESGSLTLSLLSPDGDQGFPGDLLVNVTYTLGQATLDLKSVNRISGQSDDSIF